MTVGHSGTPIFRPSSCYDMISIARGRKGKQITLDKKARLPKKPGVLLTPMENVKGSPQAVLAALKSSPPVSHEDVQELLRLIDEGKRPVRYESPFAKPRRRGRK